MLSGYINGYLRNRGQLDILGTQPEMSNFDKKRGPGHQQRSSTNAEDDTMESRLNRNQRLMLNIVKGAQQLDSEGSVVVKDGDASLR